MSDLEKIRILIKGISNSKNTEIYKSETYSIFIIFFLSIELFPNNLKIKDFLTKNKDFAFFLDNLDVELKDYLFQSRTVFIGRFIRLIENSEVSDVKNVMKVIYNIAFSENQYKDNSYTVKNFSNKKDVKNYYDSLLNSFKRG